MKAVWLALSALVFGGIGYALGTSTTARHSPSTPPISPATIDKALDSSFYGGKPNWIGISGDGAVFTQVRRRAYEFCYRGGLIERNCAQEQDEAARAAVAALNVAAAQQRMPDKQSLGLKERWVAENSEIVTRVRAYCWNLYKLHGSMDARILAVCFGNLTDFSPLVPLPVP